MIHMEQLIRYCCWVWQGHVVIVVQAQIIEFIIIKRTGARVISGIIVISNIIINVKVIRRIAAKQMIAARGAAIHTRNGSLVGRLVNGEVSRTTSSSKNAGDRTVGEYSLNNKKENMWDFNWEICPMKFFIIIARLYHLACVNSRV